MRSVALILVLLAAIVGANPTRSRREESIIATSEEPTKSDPSSLLELPEPGPIEESELAGDGPSTTKSGESVDALLLHPPSDPDALPVPGVLASAEAKSTTIEEHSDSEEEKEATTKSSDIFESVPEEPTVEVCDEGSAKGRSKIYCSGRLLASVNLHHIFPDSKTFVDRPIKANQTQDGIMTDFDSRFPPNDEIDPEQLRAFVEQHFEQEGHELEKCEVPDWNQFPPAFDGIKDGEMRGFAHTLNAIWKELCRRINPMVQQDENRFSLISVPNNFIAPGGRFREFYYWDTYWIVKGLLASGMYETTRGMLENFRHIVEQHGFIPNGGRVYYLQRSQPPLLTAMVYEYYEATRNKTFLKSMMSSLAKEFDWWRDNRSVAVELEGVNHTMFQYRTPANVPRPESYREDSTIARAFPSKGRQQAFYRDVGSAAESGWDFSTRWFADHKALLTIHTTNIVPVDLNAFLCNNLNMMSFFHGELGDSHKERAWLNDYNAFKVSFREVFYKPEARGWYDYNLVDHSHNTAFFPSIAVPLFTGCYDQLSQTQSGDLLDRMEEMGALKHPHGIPTSLSNVSQEQWDFPNGWSPLNHMVIEGMRKSDNPRLQKTAFELAQKWVNANLKIYKLDNAMWEKYNVETSKARGGGGEYQVQAGFGWSNGVVLDLLLTYGDRLTFNETLDSAPSSARLEATTVPSIVVARLTTTSSVPTPTVLPLLIIAIFASVGW